MFKNSKICDLEKHFLRSQMLNVAKFLKDFQKKKTSLTFLISINYIFKTYFARENFK